MNETMRKMKPVTGNKGYMAEVILAISKYRVAFFYVNICVYWNESLSVLIVRFAYVLLRMRMMSILQAYLIAT